MMNLDRLWYRKNFLSYLLLPFSWIYFLIITVRQFFYSIGIFRIQFVNVPVIVVGNITVGGTGKTPFVIALMNELKKAGLKPGVVSRGYGGKSSKQPVFVYVTSNPNDVGDEAVLIAKKTAVPVAIGSRRALAAQALVDHFFCNVIVSDDGLQHTSLARDIDIALIDGDRKLGNGFLLPAGPLRESQQRLHSVDFVVQTEFVVDDIVSVIDETKQLDLQAVQHKKIVAIAGIAYPEKFFQTLRNRGLMITPIAFRDHHAFQCKDIDLPADIIIMTEKDAVKCALFADHRHWVLRGHVNINPSLIEKIQQAISITSQDTN